MDNSVPCLLYTSPKEELLRKIAEVLDVNYRSLYEPSAGIVLIQFEQSVHHILCGVQGRLIEGTAVSYTHLDVYKRQPLVPWQPATPSGTWAA